MMVGTCETIPAPTISPIDHPPPRRGADVLHIGIEVEAPRAALAADPGVARAAERRPQVPDEEAVDPHGPGDQPLRDPAGAVRIARVDDGREAVLGLVRQGDGLVLVGEGLER